MGRKQINKLILDESALKLMIERNPEFEAEIQQNILSNITRRYLKESGVFSDDAFKRSTAAVTEELNDELLNYNVALRSFIKDELKSLCLPGGSEEMDKKYRHAISIGLKNEIERIFSSEGTVDELIMSYVERRIESMKLKPYRIAHMVNSKIKDVLARAIAVEAESMGLEKGDLLWTK